MNITTAAGTPAAGAMHASAMATAAVPFKFDGDEPGRCPMIHDILNQFGHVRRVIRMTHRRLTSLRVEIAMAKREQRKLGANPFNAHRIERLRGRIAGLEREQRLDREAYRKQGRILIDMAPELDAATTLEQRLDLLGCNQVDRSPLDPRDSGLVALVFGCSAEDSADYRGKKRIHRPLQSAMDAAVATGIFAAMGQAGARLVAQRGHLVVHDAGGARVIERSPS